VVNVEKSIVMKGGRVRRGTHFTYKDKHLEIVNKFSYLGMIFTSGGSLLETENGRALKAIF
jgi:hypothetical protein